jgi:hypothetical protein
MKIRLPGAGDRRWGEVVAAANTAEGKAGRGSSGLPADGGSGSRGRRRHSTRSCHSTLSLTGIDCHSTRSLAIVDCHFLRVIPQGFTQQLAASAVILLC